MRVLVTGAAGFIASHLIEHLLKHTDWTIVALDYLDGPAAASWRRLEESGVFWSPRVSTVVLDCAEPIPRTFRQFGQFDHIFHLAAETHVDRSIVDPWPFVRSNILGTMQMLEFAQHQENLKHFLYFSTDEVFGPAPIGFKGYGVWSRYNSANPYAATKAGGEELCVAWANTHKVPVVITHCMNAFGERQHVEKFVPGTIRKVLAGETVLIHADATRTQPGSRFYIHARNISAAVFFILEFFTSRDCAKFNIVGEREVSNLEMAERIAGILGMPLKYELVDFHSSRPGHDLRYALDGSTLERAGWKCPVGFEQSLEKTVLWYLKNRRWLKDDPEEEEDGLERADNRQGQADGAVGEDRSTSGNT